MEPRKLDYALTVCKVASECDIDFHKDFYFIGKTDEEYSLVCITEDTPANTLERDDGWKGVRIQGKLDFSIFGIFSQLSDILAENKIGLFAVCKIRCKISVQKSLAIILKIYYIRNRESQRSGLPSTMNNLNPPKRVSRHYW